MIAMKYLAEVKPAMYESELVRYAANTGTPVSILYDLSKDLKDGADGAGTDSMITKTDPSGRIDIKKLLSMRDVGYTGRLEQKTGNLEMKLVSDPENDEFDASALFRLEEAGQGFYRLTAGFFYHDKPAPILESYAFDALLNPEDLDLFTELFTQLKKDGDMGLLVPFNQTLRQDPYLLFYNKDKPENSYLLRFKEIKSKRSGDIGSIQDSNLSPKPGNFEKDYVETGVITYQDTVAEDLQVSVPEQ